MSGSEAPPVWCRGLCGLFNSFSLSFLKIPRVEGGPLGNSVCGLDLVLVRSGFLRVSVLFFRKARAVLKEERRSKVSPRMILFKFFYSLIRGMFE